LSELIAENIIKNYKNRTVVDGINLKVSDKKVVGLLGPNGAGKTTTFHIIAGLITPDNGKIYLDKEEITDLPMHKRSRKGITYLSQEPSVFRKLTVKENVQMVFENKGLKKEEITSKTQKLLEEMGLKRLADEKGQSLSGGERRRVEVMRALATDPKFILLDEPFAGVDPFAINDLKKIINDIKNRGIGVFISDHNVRETLTVCDIAYIVNEGKVIAFGTSEEIANNRIAKEKYLGEDFKL
jgi:lipopolysaccharide export system ATP-binding protein